MLKLERIVVGVDFSPGSLDAAHWAARHLEPSGDLVLAHLIVYPEPPPIVRRRYPRRDLLVGTLREGAEKRLRDLSPSLGVDRIWLEVRESATATGGLATVAGDYGASLLVVGTHGERLGPGGGLGTTAEGMAAAGNLPVVLVKRRVDHPSERILVAVDDDVMARAALEVAAGFSQRFGSTVTTLHVTPAGVLTHVLAAAEPAGAVEPPTQLPRTANPERGWADLAVAAGIDRERVVSDEAFGDPVAEIVAAGERMDADLIVMGRRAAGGLRRSLLGSVTNGVLHNARSSVLVVPESRSADGRRRGRSRRS